MNNMLQHTLHYTKLDATRQKLTVNILILFGFKDKELKEFGC